jgi:hypothetical protein
LSLMIDLIWRFRVSANWVGRTTGTERNIASTITDVIVLSITSRSSSVPIQYNGLSKLVKNQAKKAPIGILVVENEKIRHFTPDPHFDLEKNRKMV